MVFEFYLDAWMWCMKHSKPYANIRKVSFRQWEIAP